jgi:hypothetical protein
MFSALCGAPIVLDEPPEISFNRKTGLFCVAIKQLGLCLAYPPSAFVQAFADAANHVRELRIGKTGEVIEVDFDSKFERVYPIDKIA